MKIPLLTLAADSNKASSFEAFTRVPVPPSDNSALCELTSRSFAISLALVDQKLWKPLYVPVNIYSSAAKVASRVSRSLARGCKYSASPSSGSLARCNLYTISAGNQQSVTPRPRTRARTYKAFFFTFCRSILMCMSTSKCSSEVGSGSDSSSGPRVA